MPSLPQVEDDCAFFFDFDGTLAEIATRPEAVRVDAAVPVALQALSQRNRGAVAVISGRPIAEIDQHLSPVVVPAAGVHGVEHRDGSGRFTRLPLPDLRAAAAVLRAWCADHPGARLEDKPGALALHYRGVDELEAACLAVMTFARDAVETVPMVVLHGKKVVELKPAAADKGRAIKAFMAESPFAGRRPWFFGDDVTDEDAFDTVQSLGGVAVKVGPGETIAAHRLADPERLREWLLAQVAQTSGAASRVTGVAG
ncbi:MAG: trehalose-phosphatase [Acidobacteria bacterium]|nr:trehalose-phosphatase [Acidobacteriota bacterium]